MLHVYTPIKSPVSCVTEERVEDLDQYENYTMGPVTVRTDKGTTIEADIVFKCVGLTINAEAYRDGLGKSCYYS